MCHRAVTVAEGDHRDRLAGLSVGKGCIRHRNAGQLDEAVVVSILEMTVAITGPVC